MSKKPQIKTCAAGHLFQRSSNCNVCPVCAKKDGSAYFMAGLSAPARRALIQHAIADLRTLSNYTEKEILNWHGIGPAAIPVIRKALHAAGLRFKNPKTFK